jgi:acetyl esterase/lipase
MDDRPVVRLWPGVAAGEYGGVGEERFRSPDDAPTRDAKWLTRVTVPTLTVYRPEDSVDTGAAMVVCPGGGYWNLAWDLEGEEVAAWLAGAGITGIVLKYRVPRRPGQPEKLPAPLALLDAQRALSLVRAYADEWGVDRGRIGIVGFSAGGHLALAAATEFDRRGYEAVDAADELSCRPDFAVPVYSGYLIDEATGALAPHMRIPPGTPPVMLVHAGDDVVSDVEHSVGMYVALKRAGVPAELHVYAAGGHGFGVRSQGRPCDGWTERCLEWLQSLGLL